MFVQRISARMGQRHRHMRNFMPVRRINMHEFQSKALMEKHGINTQRFRVIGEGDDAVKAAKELRAEEFVVKAQVHAGGRGKGTLTSGLKGGVKLTKDPELVSQFAKDMINYRIITHQTPPEGVLVRKVMVAEALNIAKETYFAIVLDRNSGGPVIIASPDGGVDIEAVAVVNPDRLFRIPIDMDVGLSKEVAMALASKLGFTGPAIDEAADQMLKLCQLFLKVDAVHVEINPFGLTDKGKVVCFDAKINFDDNASFRQKEIFDQRDVTEEDPREVEAEKHSLNYIGLDGNIGCLVNGAGLAMATMDIIKHYGASPANFLDVGGNASASQVKEAFNILTADKNVRGILVNIFGGIMRCDVIAEGIVAAAKEVDLNIPLIVRLAGTNVEIGKKILNESGLDIISADNLDHAAQIAVRAIEKEASIEQERAC